MTIFSSHQINEYYRESYQSYEVVDYEYVPAGWSRDCWYIFYSERDTYEGKWYSYSAGSNGEYTYRSGDTEQRCNCPQKYGPYTAGNYSIITNIYTAVCQDDDWISCHPLPM